MNKKFQYCTRPPSAVLKISIVSERVQVNPDNSRAMNECVNIFIIIQIDYTVNKSRQTLSQPSDSGVLNLYHGYYTTIMASRRLFRHNPVLHGTNQPIRKSEFEQCMKVE